MNREEPEESSESLLEPLGRVKQLIQKGKTLEAMEIIEGRVTEGGLKELRWRIAESRCRNVMGEYEQVIKLTEEIKTKIEEIDELKKQKGSHVRNRIIIDVINEQVHALWRLGRQKDGLGMVEEGLRLVEELDILEEKEGVNKYKERKADLLRNKGTLFVINGELDQALECCEKSLVIGKELGNKELIAKSLNNIGYIYLSLGDLDSALEYFGKSLVMKEKLGNKFLISKTLTNIGAIYTQKGELDKALDNYIRSLVMREEIGNKRDIGVTVACIASIYQKKNELDSALEYFERSLEILEKADVKADIAYVLYRLIIVSLDLEEIIKAGNYLIGLQLINEQEENKVVNLYSRLSEALILKKSKRRNNLTKAEEILEEIVEEEIIIHELTVRALFNLSELLLEELRFNGEELILEELEEKVGKLMKIAKEQESYTLLAESYWLSSQLALIRLDLGKARNLLKQAQIIADKKGLERLARKISSEHDQLLGQLGQWEELIANDASITERVKVASLKELIGRMARRREIKIDEQEDKPVMLLLVSEGGLPIYCNKFDQSKELPDMLISSFLTIINNFVQEAFEVTGMITRITHEEYTLSFDLKEPILFCYVYEGQSYTAMKKLEKLMTEVHEGEIWAALEEVGKTGNELNDEEIAQMEGMIGEIFITS